MSSGRRGGHNRFMDATLRALNRFGLGARVGERGRIGDPRGWLRAQLKGDVPDVPPPAGADAQAIAAAVRAFRAAGQNDRQTRQDARRRLVAIVGSESRAVVAARVTTDRPFIERLVAFWSNHLCVSVGAKVLVTPFAGSYEREAIRPHVLGRFEDMVLASAKHPAMLVYLDNFQSIGPASRGASGGRGRGQRGLNENYARELLELHTLGVDGGYTQRDVQELARILTGWTVGGLMRAGAMQNARPQARRPPAAMRQDADGAIAFMFHDALHEPGAKTVLGSRYDEDGVKEGERAIRALCRHPSTARFVATKLVAHFVADDAPATAVDRVAQTFRDSDGDLRAVAASLIELPEAWDERWRKFRTPQDWLVAVLRAFNATEINEPVMPVLRQLRHPLWSPQAPKGFGDKTQEWADPDSLLNRAELARTVTRRFRTQSIDPLALLDIVDVPASDPLKGYLADKTIPAADRVALVLAGPAFQWR
jgi:uncharacterized protein (DUF1800 family)